MTQKNPIKAVGTAVEIVEVISELDGARVSDVAEELSLPASTVHNYFKTLEQNEYLVKEDGLYYPGLRFLGHGERARSRLEIYEVAKPELKKLAAETGELVNLVVEEHGRGVYIYRAKGNKASQFHTYVSSHVGERIYLHSSASGKVLLANMDRDQVEEILNHHGLPKLTDQTIQDRDTLISRLEEIRDGNVAFDYEEQLSGLWSVASPVMKNNDLFGAISVSGPASRFKRDRFEEELSENLKDTANVISINMTFK